MFDRIKRSARIPGGFGAGVGAALGMMVVMAILRFTTNTASIPELMEEKLIHLTGGQIESFFINTLGVGGKALLLVTIVEGTLLLGGILGSVFTHVWPVRSSVGGWRWLSGVLYGLAVGLLLNVVVLPLVDQGFFGSNALQVTAPPGIAESLYGNALAPFGLPAWFNMFLLSVIFGLALVALLPWQRAVTATPEAVAAEAATEGPAMDRRDFMKALGGGAVALVGGGVLWYGIKNALAPPPIAGVAQQENGGSSGGSGGNSSANPQQLVTAQPATTPVVTPQSTAAGEATHSVELMPTAEMTPAPPTPPVPAGFEGVKPLLVPEITPVDSFYITTKNFIDPTVDGNAWRLSFKGMVDNPYQIDLKQLKALPPVDRVETLACISNSVGGPLIGNANWKGVSFADMLQKAKPQAGVVDVVVRGADGYSDSFPLDVALKNECVLVYEMNGKPLVQKHGYPARLLVPGIYGMKNCKWITEVELVNNDYKGYWESQGWSDTAHYQTMSRIDYPNTDNIPAKPLYITGVAFAGNRGVKRVEVSTDGGKSWNDAQLRPAMGKYTWTEWTYPWKPDNGSHVLKVRATDGTGQVQTAEETNTFPDGATGYDTHPVRVG